MPKRIIAQVQYRHPRGPLESHGRRQLANRYSRALARITAAAYNDAAVYVRAGTAVGATPFFDLPKADVLVERPLVLPIDNQDIAGNFALTFRLLSTLTHNTEPLAQRMVIEVTSLIEGDYQKARDEVPYVGIGRLSPYLWQRRLNPFDLAGVSHIEVYVATGTRAYTRERSERVLDTPIP